MTYKTDLRGAALWSVAGAAVGAGAALLLAPKPGKETRKEIARLAKKTGREVEGIVSGISDSVTEIAEVVGKEAAIAVERGKDAAVAAKKDILKTIDAAQETLGRQRARISKLVA